MAAATSPPLLLAAAPGVLAWLAPDCDARHAVTAQLLMASEGGELTSLGAPLRVAVDEGDALTPLAAGRATDARTGRRHAYVALLQRDAFGDAASLRIGRLAPAESSAAHGGWAAPRWVHLARLPLPLECAAPRVCHVLDGPTLLLHLQDGTLFVAAPCAPPRAAPDALTARSSGEAAACAWHGAALRFALPRFAAPPTLLLAAWRVARGGGPAALLAMRGVPPPSDHDGEVGPSAPLPPSSFALVPLLDALRHSDDTCSAARLVRYQRAGAGVAPHALADDVTAACAVPAPASSEGADAADDVALVLRGGRVLRLRSGVIAVEGHLVVVDEGQAPTALHCVALPGGGAALLALMPDWRASAAALCARTLRGDVATADVATALPLLGPPRNAAGSDDVIGSTSVLYAPGGALLLPRGLDAMDDDPAAQPAALLPLRAAEGPAWATTLRGARVLSLSAALAVAAPPPQRAPGAAAVAAALRARVAAADDDAAAAAARIAQQGEAVAAARALLARCAAAACAAVPAHTLSRDGVDDMDDGADVACGVHVVATSLRSAFCDDEWRVAADVALRGLDGTQLCDATLALLPPAGGNHGEALPLRGRAGVATAPLRAGGPSATLVAAAPAAAMAAACGDAYVTVILTGRLLRRPDAHTTQPGADACVPFAAVLGRLQPQWAAVEADNASEPSSYTRGLPGWRRDALLRCSAADLHAAPRALCATLRLVPDAAASASEGGGGVVLRPAAGGAAPSLLPAGCAVRLVPCGGGSAAELTLTAPRRADGLRLARHVAAALPAGVIATPNAAAPPALAAAAALSEALREEIRAAITAAEGSGGGEALRCAAAALAADSGAALAALLLATAQE